MTKTREVTQVTLTAIVNDSHIKESFASLANDNYHDPVNLYIKLFNQENINSKMRQNELLNAMTNQQLRATIDYYIQNLENIVNQKEKDNVPYAAFARVTLEEIKLIHANNHKPQPSIHISHYEMLDITQKASALLQITKFDKQNTINPAFIKCVDNFLTTIQKLKTERNDDIFYGSIAMGASLGAMIGGGIIGAQFMMSSISQFKSAYALHGLFNKMQPLLSAVSNEQNIKPTISKISQLSVSQGK